MLIPGHPCAAWRRAFIKFSQQHPEVRVLDAFDAIKILQCRETMLQPFDEGPITIQVLASPLLYLMRMSHAVFPKAITGSSAAVRSCLGI